jgi:aspartyl-tRNA(Asn)/glutamyl-tRNA(Gln) amidotransferase subunit B
MNEKSSISELETVIGLEVHLQFNTHTKIFCGCANRFDLNPNILTCPICLGLPGTLPVLNKTTLEYAIKVALALNCQVNPYVKFDRKNYYYPDLPKGYQISQHEHPIARNGWIEIEVSEGKRKTVRIHRAHLEEDAGKLIHDTSAGCSLVDYNRTGTPLLEIVTEPDLRSPQEAYDYLQTLKLHLQYLNVSDCDMEKGSLRCDANISIRKKGETKLGTKSEIKNMNSFKAVRAALIFEEIRQRKLLIAGEKIHQETRLWDEDKGQTTSMRSKEEAHDYRYFPEPDLVPFTVSEELIDRIRKDLPELPEIKKERFLRDYQLNDYDAELLIQDRDLADFFEACIRHDGQPKKICNWIIGPLMQELNERKTDIRSLVLPACALAELVKKVEEGTISSLSGKDILKTMIATGQSPSAIIAEKGLTQVSDDAFLEEIIDQILNQHDNVVQQIREGKESAMGFLIGQAMRKSQGKANPKKIGEIMKRRLLNE